MATNDRRGSPPAPPRPSREAATSTTPALSDEAFIGHDAPTMVNIDVSALRKAHQRGVKTAPGIPAVEVEELAAVDPPSEEVTAPPPADETRVRPPALEALSGQKLPPRLRSFIDHSAMRYDGWFHDGLQPPSRPGLRMLAGELTTFWVMTAAERKGRPLVPFAACGAGDDTMYVAADVSVAALPVYRFHEKEGFVRVEASLDDFIANLSEATAGRRPAAIDDEVARALDVLGVGDGVDRAEPEGIVTPVPGPEPVSAAVGAHEAEERGLPAPTPPRPGPPLPPDMTLAPEPATGSAELPDLPDEVPAGEDDAMLPDEVPSVPLPMPSPRRR